MTAGRGIVHSERTPAAERASGSAISGMQTWLALPDGKEEIDPAFEHVAQEDLPLIEDTGVSARVIMGSLWGATSQIGRAHVCTPVTNAHIVCRLLLEKKNIRLSKT